MMAAPTYIARQPIGKLRSDFKRQRLAKRWNLDPVESTLRFSPSLVAFVRRISGILLTICNHNERQCNQNIPFIRRECLPQEIEHAVTMAISVRYVSVNCIIAGLMLLERTRKMGAFISSSTWRKLFATCVLLGTKLVHDGKVQNCDFKQVFNCQNVAEIGANEFEVLQLLDWNLFITRPSFKHYEALILDPIYR